MAMGLWRPSGSWIANQRLGHVKRHTLAWDRTIVPVVGGGLMVGIAAGLSVARVLLFMTLSGVGLFALMQLRSERRRRDARARRLAVAEMVGLLAAELRGGILPQRALAELAPDFSFLTVAARAAEIGGDVAAALRAESEMPGAELLGDLAGAWFVAERSGASLARVLDRLEATTREDQEIEREVQSGIAPARATGRLMAVLPLVGLSLGSGMGADPIALLTGTVVGALCLAAGSAFACTGVAWVNRIASSAERPT